MITLGGILSRPVALSLNINYVALYTNPFAWLDALRPGALLAITNKVFIIRKVMRWNIWISFFMAPGIIIFYDINDRNFLWILYVFFEATFLSRAWRAGLSRHKQQIFLDWSGTFPASSHLRRSYQLRFVSLSYDHNHYSVRYPTESRV